MLSQELAVGEAGSYRIVFVPEEFDLCVEFLPAGGSSADVRRIMIQDFLVFTPKGETHHHARDRLVALLEQMMRYASPSVGVSSSISSAGR